MSVAYAEPFRGPWTAQDVLAFPDDDICYEVVDGALIVNPPPAPRHQRASYKLHRLLDDAAHRADAQVDILEAVGIRLPRKQLLVPDVLVVPRDKVGDDDPLVAADAVSLVVEIVSPGSTTRDRHEKPHLYAEAGIPHFWRVELGTFRGRTEELPVVFAYTLNSDGDYRLVKRVGAGDTFRSTDPFTVEFDPGQLVL